MERRNPSPASWRNLRFDASTGLGATQEGVPCGRIKTSSTNMAANVAEFAMAAAARPNAAMMNAPIGPPRTEESWPLICRADIACASCPLGTSRRGIDPDAGR